MLEDIKNLVPDLDENDSNLIYNRLLEKEDEKKEKNSFNKYFNLIISFVLAVIICVPMSIYIYKNLDENSSSSNNNLEELFIPNHLFEDGTILGMAAHKEFDDIEKQNINKRSKNNFYNNISDVIFENEEISSKDYPKFSYPFDYIKIFKAYKFKVEVLDIADPGTKEIIENSCGLGLLEVVVADFGIYEGSNIRKAHCIQEDRLISLRGYNGYYTILHNGGGTSNNNNIIRTFSSHKKIIDGSIDKDFTPPILTIFEEINNDKRNIYFVLAETKLDITSYNKELSFESIGNIEYVSRDSVYSLFDIAKLQTATVEAKVLAVNFEASEYGMIYVESEIQVRLKEVHYKNYTEGVKLDSLNVGDIILIEYDMLFDGYDPINISANKVEVINNVELN